MTISSCPTMTSAMAVQPLHLLAKASRPARASVPVLLPPPLPPCRPYPSPGLPDLSARRASIASKRLSSWPLKQVAGQVGAAASGSLLLGFYSRGRSSGSSASRRKR